jgi:hypothetical protein
MARYVASFAITAFFIFTLESALAFLAPYSSSSMSSRQAQSITTIAKTSTAVQLVPEQGRQLVAFSQDYLSKRAKESAHRASNLTNPRRRQNHHPSKSSSSSSSTSSNTHHHRPGIVAGLVTRLLGQHDHQGKERMMMENHHDEQDVWNRDNSSESEDHNFHPSDGFN